MSIGSLRRDWAFYFTKELVGFVLQIHFSFQEGSAGGFCLLVCF